jgi:hypothetical protein
MKVREVRTVGTTPDGIVHFTIEHASLSRRHWSRRFPWLLFREVGYGGVEAFPTFDEAKSWADRLNTNLTWTRKVGA